MYAILMLMSFEDLLWFDWPQFQAFTVRMWEIKFVKAAAILVGAYLLRRFGVHIMRRFIDRAVSHSAYNTSTDHKKRVRTLVAVLTAFMSFGIWVIAGMMIIQLFGLQTGPLLASASIIGVAIGFGTQSLVKDLVTGMFIIIENQYRVGDEVTLGAYSGKVEAIGIRTTVLRDLDGNVHYVPNGTIMASTNKTLHFTRINMTLTVIYETDLKKLEKVINKVGEEMAGDPVWGKRIIEPPRFQRIENFAGNGLEIKVIGVTKPSKLLEINGELRRRLLVAFDDADIVIPHPAPPPPKEAKNDDKKEDVKDKKKSAGKKPVKK